MVTISKTDSDNPGYLYINLLDFNDKEEQEKYFNIIKDVINNPKKYLFTIEDEKIIKVEPLDKETQELKKTLQQLKEKIDELIEFVELDLFYELDNTLLKEKTYPEWLKLKQPFWKIEFSTVNGDIETASDERFSQLVKDAGYNFWYDATKILGQHHDIIIEGQFDENCDRRQNIVLKFEKTGQGTIKYSKEGGND